jgi:ADP-ribose pyrophosphatase YjhB (NUDIX family)
VEPKWLAWARKLQALAQNGLTYTENPYDRERYEAIQETALEMLAAGAEADMDLLRGLYAEESGYATPKVDVRGVVFREGARGAEVLLVRERVDGRWTLPGGWADVWDRPSEAVECEVREESGYQVQATKLLACWDRRLHGHPPSHLCIYKLFFRCELIGGAAAGSLETSEVGFFPEGDWPALSMARTTPWELERLFAHYRHPNWPPDFD